MNISVYYDYYEGLLAPLWYALSCRKGELDWNQNTAYIPIDAPFQRKEMDDFNSSALGITVTLGEMILHIDKPGMIGIYLPPLKQRTIERGYDYWNTEQLIIQVSDIEELIQMNLFQ